MEFKIWIENIVAKENGIRDTVLNFLKSKIKIHDDDAILNMSLNSIDKGVISDLLRLGIVNTSDDATMQDIQNGTLTVQDLIARLAGEKSNSMAKQFATSQNF